MNSLKQNSTAKHVLLTGKPGIGKTTLVKRISEKLKSLNIPMNGFFTEEIRKDGKRIGFDIVSLSGKNGPLARLRNVSNHEERYIVGQYAVLLHSFEEIALPIFKSVLPGNGVLVIDEIGKMELKSKHFKDCVIAAFDSNKVPILGTIPLPKGQPLEFIENLKKRTNVKVFLVDYDNRNSIENEIIEAITSAVNN